MKIMSNKALVFAVIVLFIGAGIVPSMGGMISELSSIKIMETDITSSQSDSVKAQNSVYVNGGSVDYINIQDALNVASNSDTSNHYVVNQISRATGTILIIDDDNDIYFDDDNSIERFESVIGDMGYIVTNESAPTTDNATWSTYDCIVWSCGDDLTPIFDAEYKQMLIDYVADGGHLILESGHIAAWIDKFGAQTVDQNLRIEVLHATTDFVYCDVGDMAFKNTHPIVATPNILPATIGFTATYPGDDSGDADAVRCLEDAVGVYGWSDVRWSGSSVAGWVIEACNGIITYDDDDDINNGGQIVFLTIDIDDIDNIEMQNQLIENVVTWVVNKTNDVWVDDDYNASTPGWNVTHFDNMQDAIDAVAESGTVYVYNGTYHENVIVNKTISLIGEDRSSTYIVSGGIGDVVSITADLVNISKFAVGESGSSSYNAGINVISSNNNIANCNIYLNYGDGIRLTSSSGNTISNCDVFSNGIVVYRKGIVLLSQSNNNLITNCSVWDNSEGIDIDHSDDNDVTNCNIYSNVYRGIYIDVDSNSNLVKNSDMLNNGWGIIFYASYNTVRECNISYNDYGTCLYASNNTIQECNISYNDHGVSIHASYNTVRECNISYNDYGIHAYSSHHYNHIYHNNIIENAIYQAYDSGSNVWDDDYPSGGNYWSDFDEPSEGAYDLFKGPNQDIPGSDGIIDNPYSIPNNYSKDYYPLISPWSVHPLGYITTLSDNWNFISLPFNQSINKTNIMVSYQSDNLTWADACTAGIVSDYIFGWDRAGQSYTFADILEPGFGYWVYAYESCELWIENVAISYDSYITDVEQNWNIISVPYNENVSKTDILVDDIDWDTAVSNGWISDYVFGWSRTGQNYNFADTLMPGYAYWMYAYEPCTLKRVI